MEKGILQLIVVGVGFCFMGCSDDVSDQSSTSGGIYSDADSDTDSDGDSDSDADGDTESRVEWKDSRDSETVSATLQVCNPGRIQGCSCGDVMGGVTTCNSAGDGWSNCICDSGGDTDSEVQMTVDSESETSASVDFTCATGEAHVVVAVDTLSDYLPWLMWPDDADGEGNLVVALTTENGSVYRESILPANIATGSEAFALDFCTQYSSGKVEAFLDDDLDAAPGATFSGDYLDTCMGTNGECFRCMNVEFSPNTVTEVRAVLEGSCD